MIFFCPLGWLPEQDASVLSRYPKSLLLTQIQKEELLQYTAPKLERQEASCVYLLNAIYANAANRPPTQEELDANIKSLMIEPLLKKLIAALDDRWKQLQTGMIRRIDLRAFYETEVRRTRIEIEGWSFSFEYEYDDGMLCLSPVQMQHPAVGVLVRDKSRPYDEGFEIDPILFRRLDEILFKCASAVEDLPEIQEYLRQFNGDEPEGEEE
jgi:hypothetical protein